MLDLLIVGGGPSGISTALHVQAQGTVAKIAVLEKERYPRDKICAGGIGARAFRILERIGVEVACPHVKIDSVALRVGTEVIAVREPGCGAVVRRIQFDHAFADVARARGIDIREGCEVARITADDSGVTVELASGEALRARAIVGADGVAGIVRRACGFPRGELRAQVVELDSEASPADLPRDTVVFDFATRELRGYAWDFPTLVDDAPLVCRGVYLLHDAARVPDQLRGRMAAYLAERGLDLARYKLKQFAEQGWAPGAAISAPRVLLVGEAAGIDIATGEGIGQAIEYGAVAGPYLAAALVEDALGFEDWTRVVGRHHLGWQLAIRHGCYRAFYGRRRPTIERLMPQLGELMKVAIQDFAGVPMSKLAMVRGAGQFLAAFTRAKLAHPTGTRSPGGSLA